MTFIKFTRYTIPFLIKYLLLALVHEMGHLLTLLILGLRAELGHAWYGIFTYNIANSQVQVILVTLAGALCVPFGFYLAGEEEGQDKLEWATVSWIMLGYSIVEILYFAMV